jgi:antibiotic biosynthesis monooxygenase (ABM) superfamily enzyme
MNFFPTCSMLQPAYHSWFNHHNKIKQKRLNYKTPHYTNFTVSPCIFIHKIFLHQHMHFLTQFCIVCIVCIVLRNSPHSKHRIHTKYMLPHYQDEQMIY